MQRFRRLLGRSAAAPLALLSLLVRASGGLMSVLLRGVLLLVLLVLGLSSLLLLWLTTEASRSLALQGTADLRPAGCVLLLLTTGCSKEGLAVVVWSVLLRTTAPLLSVLTAPAAAAGFLSPPPFAALTSLLLCCGSLASALPLRVAPGPLLSVLLLLARAAGVCRLLPGPLARGVVLPSRVGRSDPATAAAAAAAGLPLLLSLLPALVAPCPSAAACPLSPC